MTLFIVHLLLILTTAIQPIVQGVPVTVAPAQHAAYTKHTTAPFHCQPNTACQQQAFILEELMDETESDALPVLFTPFIEQLPDEPFYSTLLLPSGNVSLQHSNEIPLYVRLHAWKYHIV